MDRIKGREDIFAHPRVRTVLGLAQKEAKSLNHTYVGTEHILLGLLREGDGVAARVLKNLDVSAEHVRQEILKELDPNFVPGDNASVVPNPAPSTNPMAAQTFFLDVTKRYDVYCAEKNGGALVVYRNVLFKSRKKLFPRTNTISSRSFWNWSKEMGKRCSFRRT